MAKPSLAAFHEGLLKAARYVVVDGQFVAPGLHRLRLAAGLSGGLLGGRLLMNLVSGQHPDGSDVRADNVPAPLRPALGIMRFNNYSDKPSDRWLNAVDNLTPAVFGAIGVTLASRWHFADRLKEAERIEDAVFAGTRYFSHEDVNRTLSMRQAEALAKATAAVSTLGSSSGANLTVGYGQLLSGLFTLRGDKKAFSGTLLGRWFTGTKATSPLGDEGNMRELLKHVLLHADKGSHTLEKSRLAESLGEALPDTTDVAFIDGLRNYGGGVMHGLLKNARDEHLGDWLHEVLAQRDAMLEELKAAGKLRADGKPKLDEDTLNGLAAKAWNRLERFGVERGLIDMSSPAAAQESVHICDNGKLGEWSEKSSAKAREHRKAQSELRGKNLYAEHHAYAQQLHGEKKIPAPGPALSAEEAQVARPSDLPDRKRQAMFAGAALGTAGLIGHSAVKGNEDRAAHLQDNNAPHHRLAEAVNGKPLDVIEWIGNALNYPPGLHRLSNAAGLSAGMFGGMKIGELLTGQTLTGKMLAKDAFFKPLQRLHGLMSYDFHGLDHGNRWMKIAHYTLPALGGFYGVKIGSDHFFEAQRERNHHAEFLDDYAKKISYDQSMPWGNLSAVMALTNVGIGAGFLPFGFGMDLGTRFGLGSDHKVVAPVLGKFWSNNRSKWSLGPASLRDRTINYLLYNPDKEPQQLNEMTKGILEAWFGDQPASKIQQFAGDMLAVRNRYYHEGGIPQKDMKAARKDLEAHFVHQGLHDELAHCGFEVLQAKLDNNGLSGDIADGLGARKRVDRDIADFRQKEISRRNARHPLANDNFPAANENRLNHSERIAQNRNLQLVVPLIA